jgi:oligopeptidase B
VLGGFNASNYVTERKWANAPDGTQIPLSIVYHKDLVKLDGSDPLLLYGYGSYEVMKYFID